ncbi:MAG TPA: TetR/AcrR family transcriptional regulator [Fluviicoccus sp.]|nr:TetR/AcrR family transcriptional regulator [Fluviicoccus sp.]
MSSDPEIQHAHLKRVPRQERSQQRFETIVAEALRLFGENGYEAVSMREIAREAECPIASVYQYFPTKQAIVKEIWVRYSQTVREALAGDLQRFVEAQRLDGGEELIDRMVDLITELQLSSPAYVEVWGCIAATPELRALNDQDTLNSATLIAEAILAIRPEADRERMEGLTLMLTEAGSSITKLTLSLPAEQRNRIIARLKQSMKILYRATLGL